MDKERSDLLGEIKVQRLLLYMNYFSSSLSWLGRTFSSLPVSQGVKGKPTEFGESYALGEFSTDTKVSCMEDEQDTHSLSAAHWQRGKAVHLQNLYSGREGRKEEGEKLDKFCLKEWTNGHIQFLDKWRTYSSFFRRWKSVVSSLQCFLLQKIRNLGFILQVTHQLFAKFL